MSTLVEAAIGRSVRRNDGKDKVIGATRYAGDLIPPGALCVALATSPHARAAVLGIDLAAAKAVPGVVAVVTAADLHAAFPQGQGEFLLAERHVTYAGQPVAAVLAETEAIAGDAASLIVVEYSPLPASADPLVARQAGAPLVHPDDKPPVGRADLSGNVRGLLRYTRGDIAAGLAAADHIESRTYRTARVHQGYLEPLATVGLIDPSGVLELRTSTQAQLEVRDTVAAALGREPEVVRVVAPPVGGGFGAKYGCLEPLVGALTLHAARPVALVLDRDDDFRCTGPAPESIIALDTGVTRDGRIVAIRARIVYDGGIAGGSPVEATCQSIGGYYRCDNIDIEGYEVLTNKPAPGAYRGPGIPQATFALESNVDEMARAIGMDPLAFRLANASVSGDPRVDGKRWPTLALTSCIAALQRHPAYGEPVDRSRGEGIGVAIGGLQTSVDQPAAICRLAEDGTIELVIGLIDISGAHTALAQVAADALGVPYESVRVILAASDVTPYAGATGGSKGVYTVSPAVAEASAQVREQLLAVAAEQFEASPDDLAFTRDGIAVRGVPDQTLSFAAIAQRVATDPRYSGVLRAESQPESRPKPAA
ncbi:MAG TPA: xanthine dehydrogenase family protein, partial [Thermomicrobiales bacterium]